MIRSDEYMEVDGTPLQTLAMNIETVGGDRRAPGKFRGSNRTVPHRRGAMFIPKVPDERTLSLNMWIRGCDEDGLIPTGRSARALYEQNLDKLINLLWRGEDQMVLTKRVFVGESIKPVDALAEFKGGLSPEMIGRRAAKLTVDLGLADPFFYDRTYTTVALANGNTTITVPGTTKTTKVLINVAGVRVNPVITNTTYGVGSTIADTFNAGDTGQIDVDAKNNYVTRSGSSRVKKNSSLAHQGDPEWFYLKPGVNVISLASTSGTGTVSLQYKAAYV